MSFVHLHLHTEYSLLDGACRISAIPDAVKKAGQTAVAITDHSALYGALPFYQACTQAGIKPIIGCEVYVAPRSMEDKDRLLDSRYTHLTLLVENETGYRNLLQIVSRSFTKGFFDVPRTDKATLEKYASGLIALSGDRASGTSQCLLDNDRSGAREWILFLVHAFGKENVYLELIRSGLPGEKQINEGLVRFASELDLPLVATNDVKYLTREDASTQRMLCAIRDGSTFREYAPISEEQAYLKTETEMELLFPDLPEAIANTGKIAERCNFAFDCSRYHLPVFATPNGEDAGEYLRTLCAEGYRSRIARGCIPGGEEYTKRIDYELDVILSMGFADYYLIVCDFVQYAKKQNIPVGPGRGSGVGSLVAYCIGITDVDPIRFGLLFERFLNPERVSMPDFDIDFSDERRGEVIDYVVRTYGKDHVAQIVTFGTMACKQALRDAGRALGMPGADVDAVVRLLPRSQTVTLEQALQESAELRQAAEQDSDVRKLLHYAGALEGRVRNTSTHASGVVITDKPLTQYLPLAVNDPTAQTVLTQYTMNAISDLGLLKIDFLGLRDLSILRDAEDRIRKRVPDFRVEDVPFDDAKTFAMLSEGNSAGLFQLESRGMRSLLKRLRPHCFADIVSVISLFRPGPSLSIETFLQNRKEPEKTVYAVPELAPILQETHGCMLYQEQVMQICRDLAGYTLGHADLVRRAMAKKKQAEMEREEVSFLQGCQSNGIDAQSAKQIFELMKEFAKYAFNKSHAVAYAVLAYRGAYLKAHYPQEFLCALLSASGGAQEKLAEYASELQDLGIRVLPPDVNRSEVSFSIEQAEDGTRAIRYGLGSVKNVGSLFAGKIVAQRNAGAYRSLEDFLTQVSPFAGSRPLEALTRAGALDGFGVSRSGILHSLEHALEQLSRIRSSSSVGQMGMFDSPEEENSMLSLQTDEPEALTPTEKLSDEKEYTGLYFSGHPLDRYGAYRAQTHAKSIREIREGLSDGSLRPKQEVHCVGMISAKRVRLTKQNTSMAFLRAEDQSGTMELILFPKQYEQFDRQVTIGAVLDLTGSVSLEADRDGRMELQMILKTVSIPETDPKQSSAILSEKEEEKVPALYLKVTSENQKLLDDALRTVRACPGKARILVYFAAEKKLRALRDTLCDPNAELLSKLKNQLGDENVAVK